MQQTAAGDSRAAVFATVPPREGTAQDLLDTIRMSG